MTAKPPSDWPYAHVIAEAFQNSSSPAADSVVASGSPGGETSGPHEAALDELRSELVARLKEVNGQVDLASIPRRDLVRQISEFVSAILKSADRPLNLSQQRELVSLVLADLMSNCGPASGPANGSKKADLGETAEPPERLRASHSAQPRNDLLNNKQRIQPLLMERIDTSVILQLSRKDLAAQISEIVSEILAEEKLRLNRKEQQELVAALLDDMLGLGPLEPLLADETVNDILVNGPKQVYVERGGRLERTDVTFRDNAHVMNVATRIVTRIGRRIDESTPLVDARLEDGSRVNIIVPPLAIDGPSISIRKFSKKKITLEKMVEQANLSYELATMFKIAARCRLNILISGGTGSGKTTLLNALSRTIDHAERIVTIEDAAELQLQQPHVVRLETRPPNLEDRGEITQRDLLKNALRMRPDRIILGEVRGAEALDMLQAMNTGHDGSMSTVHANTPREALTRLEHMVAMSGVNLPSKAVRAQTAAAINIVVQISRMRDGIRRVTQVCEVVGMEEDIVTMKDLFWFEFEGEENGRLSGSFRSSGLRPKFLDRAQYFGLGKMLVEAMGCQTSET